MAKTASPYKVKPKGDKWVVVNNMGEEKGEHDSKEEAVSHLRALYANVPGAPGKAEKKKWTGKQKRPSTVKAANAEGIRRRDPSESPVQRLLRLTGKL